MGGIIFRLIRIGIAKALLVQQIPAKVVMLLSSYSLCISTYGYTGDNLWPRKPASALFMDEGNFTINLLYTCGIIG